MENQGAKVYSERTDSIRIINTQPHPLFGDTPQCHFQIGEIQLVRNPDKVTGQKVEIWRFQLWNENEKAERELYTKAFSKLLNLLKTTYPEYRKIGRLRADSANVVRFLGWQFTPSINLISRPEFQVIAEWCTGGNFKDAAKHFLPIHMIRKWLYEMLCGLDFLHRNRIIHHNLHSRIIYFTEANFKGTVKIGGFNHRRRLEVPDGLAARHDPSCVSTEDGRFVAPELVDASDDYDIGRRSDIWSAGCVALHLLTGQPPLYVGARNRPIKLEMAVVYYLNSSERNLDERRPFIPESLPKSTTNFVLRCLKFDPKERPLASELLGRNGELFFFHAKPDNPRRYQSQGMRRLPQDTLDYWAKNIKVSIPRQGASSGSFLKCCVR
ncbi:mitogen-activated protein kinase kinase kinase A-like [Paramacrobiotus metropolitanus]|uniref:mitogen-activated protein kinase kinase kinase A-like n=1 Tax=Paramacrobiotus metropolitanus TaxID=2943436 RepID=UPI00244631DC|nr:mitogen-activated protein kinase kinase kinase A-like [Paramacrobiotus metropolitanus]